MIVGRVKDPLYRDSYFGILVLGSWRLWGLQARNAGYQILDTCKVRAPTLTDPKP